MVPSRLSIVDLIRLGTIDAELAALLWLLVEGHVSVVVAAGPGRVGKSTLLEAILDLLPEGQRRIVLRGIGETFDTLDAADPAGAWVVASELSDHLPAYTWGRGARTAVRSISNGFALAATIHADSLEEVFELLSGPEVGSSSDELSLLGVVLVIRAVRRPIAARRPGSGLARRVVAAHFVRPVARDGGGHIQRLGPAVLATWEPRTDTFEHFAWGVVPELAIRVGMRPGDFEAELARRRTILEQRAAALG